MPHDLCVDTPAVVRALVQCEGGDEPAWMFISNPNRSNHLGLGGGEVERGETPEQALIRELEEELGIQVELQEITLEHTWNAPATSRNDSREKILIQKSLYIATIPLARARTQRYHPTKNPGRPRPHGNGGEEAHIATPRDIPWIFDGGHFLPAHLKYLQHSVRDLLSFLRYGRPIPPRRPHP